MPRPRVLLADDHVLLLDAFRSLLGEVCDVVGSVANGRDLLNAVAELRPDIVVLDVTMPLLNGLDAARLLRQESPATRLIFLTMNEDPEVAAEAFKVGAAGYLLKSSAGSELRQAITEVALGRSYITPMVAADLLAALQEPRRGLNEEPLTPRQREVVQLIAEGRSLKEIAAILDISPRTAAFHKYRIMDQLKARSTAELVQYAVRHHIV
jgi:DNA-binding NarL/FixJ family response regulator